MPKTSSKSPRTADKAQPEMDEPDADTFPLPEEGDYLFERGKFSIDQAPIEHQELFRFHNMKDGYKLAGDVLVEYWLLTKRGRLADHRLVFPILFCYRHFLELSMKWFLWHRGEYRSQSILRTHDLQILWSKCRLVLRDFQADADPEVEAAQKLILEMHEKDNGSFNFRYSHSKSGEIIDLGIEAVDLLRLRKHIEKLDNFFDIAETIMNAELDARLERMRWW